MKGISANVVDLYYKNFAEQYRNPLRAKSTVINMILSARIFCVLPYATL